MWIVPSGCHEYKRELFLLGIRVTNVEYIFPVSEYNHISVSGYKCGLLVHVDVRVINVHFANSVSEFTHHGV